jgi:ABC-type molybdate transport system ATPase subunit
MNAIVLLLSTEQIEFLFVAHSTVEVWFEQLADYVVVEDIVM